MFDPSRLAKPALVVAFVVVVLAAVVHAERGQASPSFVATAPSLGMASEFAVLGASTVTNTGDTVLTGDLGVSPGTAITGFPPGTYSGELHAGDDAADDAQLAVTVAWNDLTAQACDTTYIVPTNTNPS